MIADAKQKFVVLIAHRGRQHRADLPLTRACRTRGHGDGAIRRRNEFVVQRNGHVGGNSDRTQYRRTRRLMRVILEWQYSEG